MGNPCLDNGGVLAVHGSHEVLLPYLVKEALHGTASNFGIILGAGGVGAIAAALIVGQMGLPRRQLTFMYLCWTLAALAVGRLRIGHYGVAAHDHLPGHQRS